MPYRRKAPGAPLGRTPRQLPDRIALPAGELSSTRLAAGWADVDVDPRQYERLRRWSRWRRGADRTIQDLMRVSGSFDRRGSLAILEARRQRGISVLRLPRGPPRPRGRRRSTERHTTMRTTMARSRFRRARECRLQVSAVEYGTRSRSGSGDGRFIGTLRTSSSPARRRQNHLAVALGLKACALDTAVVHDGGRTPRDAHEGAHRGRLEERLKLLVQPKLSSSTRSLFADRPGEPIFLHSFAPLERARS